MGAGPVTGMKSLRPTTVTRAALQSWDLYHRHFTPYTGETPSRFFMNRFTFDMLCQENGVNPLGVLVDQSTILGLPIELAVIADGRVGLR